MKLLPAPANTESRLSSVDIERLVLGSLLLNPRTAGNTLSILEPRHFAIERHRLILDAMLRLNARQITPDRVVVAQVLKAMGKLEAIGGLTYITSLDDELPIIHNLEAYIRILEDAAIRREASNLLESATNALVDQGTDAITTLERTQSAIQLLQQGVRREDSLCSLNETIERLEGGFEAFGCPSATGKGIATPWNSVNSAFLGFRPGHLYVVGARPRHGKTIFGAQIAQAAAEHFHHQQTGQYAAFFTLEQSREEIFQRACCSAGMVHYGRFQEGTMTAEERNAFTRASAYLNTIPFVIDDTPIHSPASIASVLARTHRDRPIGLVIVDYLQLMTVPREVSREIRSVQVSAISRALKLTARQFGIPIVVLAQLNRKSESEERRPNLTDLRESGGIEQDATAVFLLWNLARIPKSDSKSAPKEKFPGQTEIILAKQRNGDEAICNVRFEGPFVRFVDPSEPSNPQPIPPPAPNLWDTEDDGDSSIDL